MAYYNKDTYEKKKNYANKISKEGIESIALYYALQDMGIRGKDMNDCLEEWNIYLDSIEDEDTLDSEIETLEDKIEDYKETFEPIRILSHTRHEVHSTDRKSLVYDCSELHSIGTEYSTGETLIDQVNNLNREYNFTKKKIPIIRVIEPDSDIDSWEDILDYYDETPLTEEDDEDYEEKNRQLAIQLMIEDWDESINEWSNSVRDWFKDINKRFDTDFPD